MNSKMMLYNSLSQWKTLTKNFNTLEKVNMYDSSLLKYMSMEQLFDLGNDAYRKYQNYCNLVEKRKAPNMYGESNQEMLKVNRP